MWIDGIPNVVIILAVLLVLFLMFKDQIMGALSGILPGTQTAGTA